MNKPSEKKLNYFVKLIKSLGQYVVENIIKTIISTYVLIVRIFIKQDSYLFNSPYGYQDNAKYLAKFFCAQKERCYWYGAGLVDDKEINLIRTDIDLFIQLPRLKCIFYTHSSKSISRFLPFNIVKVNLHHGIALKKSGYDSERDIDRLMNYAYNPYNESNFIISSSEETRSFFKTAMKVNENKILPYGQPRNDFLFTNKYNSNLISELKNKITAKGAVTMYAPTFRDNDIEIETLAGFIDIWLMYFKNKPEDHSLIIRLHPKQLKKVDTWKDLPSNIYLSSHVDDVQELLLISDYLISDYSSLILDFEILERPQLLYWFDYKEYVSERGGFYYDLENLFSGILKVQKRITAYDFHRLYNSRYNQNNLIGKFHAPDACNKIYKRFVENRI